MNRARTPSATSFFDNIQRTFTSLDDKLEKSVQEHLRNVYATVAAGVGAAAIGAAVHIFTNVLRANFLLSLASIGLMFALISTPHTRANEKKRLAFFFLFCGISGVSMGPLLERVIAIDPSCVLTALLATTTVFGCFSLLCLTALLATTTVFGCFSLVALHAPSTKYIHMGGTLASAALCLLFATFFASYYVIILGGLALSCAFVVYDTQLIAEKSRRGDDDYIWHSVELFIDFANIFRANFLLSLASIGLMFALISTPHTRANEKKRLAFFFLFCGISGVSMGPLLERVIAIDPSCVLTALLATTTVFGCFSLVALHAPSTKYIHMGGTLASAALCLLFATFFASYYVIILGGLALSCAFVVYDTQLIAEKSRRGDDDYIWHSVELFIDFANIFRYLVVLLADKKERDNRKRRD
ncbi:hypothetical protein OSTOST_09706 [Ostertagia ostertagi]